jgi:uncharacterized protein with HEPN domain
LPSDPRAALLDIRDNIHLAQQFTADMTYEQFAGFTLVFYAVTRCLEIISEASRRLPGELKQRHPNIPWALIAGAGNVYRDDYEDVQIRLVRGTATTRLTDLLESVDKEIGPQIGHMLD